MTEPNLRVCRDCGRYTLREDCPEGHGPTHQPHPARFNPNDRYGTYRRLLLAEVAGARTR